MDYKKVSELARKYFPDASDDEIKKSYDEIMKRQPGMTYEELEAAAPDAADQIRTRMGASIPNRKDKMGALSGMGGF